MDSESVWSVGQSVGWVVRYGIQSTNKSPEYSNEITRRHPCEGGRRPVSSLLGTDCLLDADWQWQMWIASAAAHFHLI